MPLANRCLCRHQPCRPAGRSPSRPGWHGRGRAVVQWSGRSSPRADSDAGRPELLSRTAGSHRGALSCALRPILRPRNRRRGAEPSDTVATSAAAGDGHGCRGKRPLFNHFRSACWAGARLGRADRRGRNATTGPEQQPETRQGDSGWPGRARETDSDRGCRRGSGAGRRRGARAGPTAKIGTGPQETRPAFRPRPGRPNRIDRNG